MKSQTLPPAFFARDTLAVARELLGAHICRRLEDRTVMRLPITEVEAYVSAEDRACHAARGRTPRTEVMFGPAGRWYIYLCYGMYWMINIVTMRRGHPAAVLLRGAGMFDGPGKLSRGLQVDHRWNNRRAIKTEGLWFERGTPVQDRQMRRTPRIGVDYAGPDWTRRPYRFIQNTEAISKTTSAACHGKLE